MSTANSLTLQKLSLLSILNNHHHHPATTAPTYNSLLDPHNIYFLYSINNILQMISTHSYTLDTQGYLVQTATQVKIRKLPRYIVKGVNEKLLARREKGREEGKENFQGRLPRVKSLQCNNGEKGKLAMYSEQPFRIQNKKIRKVLKVRKQRCTLK